MAVRYLDSRYGKVKPYKGNPRKISDGAFTKLCESIQQDPEFMETRPIVIDETNAILGGNQRQYAILSLLEGGWSEEAKAILETNGWGCVLEGKLPDAWVRQLTKPDWMTPEEWESKKKRFVLKDNSPEGMAGEFDYEIMGESFTLSEMSDSGIDFSNLSADLQEEAEESASEQAEKGDGYGEKDPKLQKFIQNREEARAELDELTDAEFYLCVVFQDKEQKLKFLEAANLPHEGGMYASGLTLADLMGIEIERKAYDFPTRKVDGTLAGLAMENAQEPEGAGDTPIQE